MENKFGRFRVNPLSPTPEVPVFQNGLVKNFLVSEVEVVV